MEARDRVLPDWFNRTRSGQVRLPRFQRGQEWTQNEIQSLLNAVLRDLPVGAALVLEIGDEEPFISRPMGGAPDPVSKATEHLLDGQQRLTALWRAFHDDYERHSYFLRFVPDESGDSEIPEAVGQGRWTRNGQRYPIWADDPSQLNERGLVPLRLLRPEDVGGEAGEWCDAATDNLEASRALERKIQRLRERVNTYNLPFLSLPIGTPKATALEVFIKVNTSYVRLSPFDIVVAEVEEQTGESLTDLREQLRGEIPEADDYLDLDDFILSVAALRQGRPATQASYFSLDLSRLVAEWGDLKVGIAWAVGFLAEERVFDAQRLPTVAVPPVLAALHGFFPDSLDEHANARSLLRKYVWRGFLTRRYAAAAATAAFQDFQGLRNLLSGRRARVPIFDDLEFPYPTAVEELIGLPWPKRKNILARGVLAVASQVGARDVADDTPVSRENVRNRQYHHLFPRHLLEAEGRVSTSEVNQALNCALITWNTNLDISAKEPLKYLRERVERSAAHLGEPAIRERLESHIIPFDSLAVGGYDEIADQEKRTAQIRVDYAAFLEARAHSFLPVIHNLCALPSSIREELITGSENELGKPPLSDARDEDDIEDVDEDEIPDEDSDAMESTSAWPHERIRAWVKTDFVATAVDDFEKWLLSASRGEGSVRHRKGRGHGFFYKGRRILYYRFNKRWIAFWIPRTTVEDAVALAPIIPAARQDAHRTHQSGRVTSEADLDVLKAWLQQKIQEE